LNIFSLEYLVLVLIALAAGYKAMKEFRAGRGKPSAKKGPGKGR